MNLSPRLLEVIALSIGKVDNSFDALDILWAHFSQRVEQRELRERGDKGRSLDCHEEDARDVNCVVESFQAQGYYSSVLITTCKYKQLFN
jgi:hypothetical protein